MPSRFYKPSNNAPDLVSTRTDILEDLPQRRARQELLPQIAKMSKNAVQVTPHWFEVMHRQRVGRRCSCFSVEDDAAGTCKICFATGVVGGYQKRGTKVEILDVTAHDLLMANVEIDFDHPTRPLTFRLRDGIKRPRAVYGELDWTMPLTSNVGIIDTFQVLKSTPTGSSIDVYVKTGNEANYTLASITELQKRIHSNKLYFRVVFKRDTPKSHAPRLLGIRIAYKVLATTAIMVDIPLNTYSMVLEEFGIVNAFSSLPFFADNTVKVLTTEDFMYDVQEGMSWKIVEVTRNAPLGVLTSWNLTSRIVHPFEPYRLVPVGDVPVLNDGAFAIRSRETEAEMTRTGLLQVKHPLAQSDRMPTNFQQENLQNTVNVGQDVATANNDPVRRR